MSTQPARQSSRFKVADRFQAVANKVPVIPGYEDFQRLGSGGMAVVYKARQVQLNRMVAVKIIRPSLMHDPDIVKRFVREARSMANLRHAGIVPIYEMGGSDNIPYFSFELAKCSLDKYLTDQNKLAKDAKMTDRDAVKILLPIAEGIAVAHKNGLIHRDIKPSNILLTADITPMLSDFGLVKRVDIITNFTDRNAIMGTPGYMAPECYKGAPPDKPIDIYAFGVVMYEMLTGRRPHNGDNLYELMCKVCNDVPVSPRVFRPKLARRLTQLCLRCLEKDPLKRPTADEIVDQLKFVMNSPDHWKKRLLGMLLVTAASLFLFFLSGVNWHSGEAKQTAEEELCTTQAMVETLRRELAVAKKQDPEPLAQSGQVKKQENQGDVEQKDVVNERIRSLEGDLAAARDLVSKLTAKIDGLTRSSVPETMYAASVISRRAAEAKLKEAENKLEKQLAETKKRNEDIDTLTTLRRAAEVRSKETEDKLEKQVTEAKKRNEDLDTMLKITGSASVAELFVKLRAKFSNPFRREADPANPESAKGVPAPRVTDGTQGDIGSRGQIARAKSGSGGESVSVKVVNEKFTITATKGEVKFTILGWVLAGDPVPLKIQINDGETQIDVVTIDKVPSKYSGYTKQLLKSMKDS